MQRVSKSAGAAIGSTHPTRTNRQPFRKSSRRLFVAFGLAVGVLGTMLTVPDSIAAQEQPTDAEAKPQAPVDATALASDSDIRQRIRGIYSEIDALAAVDVSVREGVVTLSGNVPNGAAQRAVELAQRIQGVVTVENKLERTLDLETNLAPLLQSLKADLVRWSRALPLLLVALLLFLSIAYAGHRLAKWSNLWRRLAPNAFLADLLAQAVRIAAVVLGLVLALNLLGATALMGTILGGAGVLGLALGFAVRDSLDNYISSIMLSLRQPFRANDHVLVNEHEGRVVRLTSRATVLMTLDGNHLRIPNSTVFKAVILNYTRNPERRFEFDLGVDADDDPLAAMSTGIEAISGLDIVLADPAPTAYIKTVGDSNIVVCFMAWVDQEQTDFRKARSLAIRAAKRALEERGFTLPEPIYRLRFDPDETSAGLPRLVNQPTRYGRKTPAQSVAKPRDDLLNARPDMHLEEKVDEERALDRAGDLLDSAKPVE